MEVSIHGSNKCTQENATDKPHFGTVERIRESTEVDHTQSGLNQLWIKHVKGQEDKQLLV